MKALNLSIFESDLDKSKLNLDKDPSTKFVVACGYGANTNLENLFGRVKDDWNAAVPDHIIHEYMDLTEYILGVYKLTDRQLIFNKSGDHANSFSYANVSFRPQGEAYALVYMIPKAILFNPRSTLNAREGCFDIHNVENATNHYWLRQVTGQPHRSENSPIKTFPKINGSETLDCIWMYEAAPSKVVVNPAPPQPQYVRNIIRGLSNGDGKFVPPQSYLTYLESFLNPR